MRFILPLLILLASCTINNPRYRDHEKQREAYQELATVAIAGMCVEPEGVKTWYGSGVIIGPSSVMTAHHVVDCAGTLSLQIQTNDGTIATVTTSWESPDHDLAIVKTAESLLIPTHFAIGAKPKNDSEICTQNGYPNRYRICGKVQSDTRDTPGRDIEYRGINVPGNSGSGCFDSRGHLVGVLTSGTGEVSWCSSLEQFRDILSQYTDKAVTLSASAH